MSSSHTSNAPSSNPSTSRTHGSPKVDSPPAALWDEFELDVQLDYDYDTLTAEERQLIQDAKDGVDVLARDYVVRVRHEEKSDKQRYLEQENNNKGTDGTDSISYKADKDEQLCEDGINRMWIQDEE
ncbi:MAG: hypothetical protein Q9171_004390 [Xanthocarpia ochracea]